MAIRKPRNTASRVVPGLKDRKVHAYDEFDDDVERKVRIFTDFLERSGGSLDKPFTTQDTSSSGTPVFAFGSAPNADGIWSMQPDTTNEVENITLYFGDSPIIPILNKPVLKARFAILPDVTGAGGAFAAGDKFVLGLASSRNATLDSITRNAWIRFEGATQNILIETDDGTTDTDDVDTGLDWIDGAGDSTGFTAGVMQVKIDFSDLSDVKFWMLREGTDTEFRLLNVAGTAMDMSATGVGHLQFFCELQKAAAANQDHKVVFDYVDITWQRSSL